jgi:GNAT superfamily N-acetyltransferase
VGGPAACKEAAKRRTEMKRTVGPTLKRVWGMYVALSHRRSGIGELLLKAALQQAQSWQGVQQVVLSVTEVADEARRLYERAGFRAWGREPRALYSDGRYADETYMIRNLTDA